MGAGKNRIDENGGFVIENYNRMKPFAGFLPAIAGLHGKPMWLYYVNRGQCVSTFGVNNKDNAIMEFEPANKAYRRTPLEGFRTFLRIYESGEDRAVFYEPFQDVSHCGKRYDVVQRMILTSHDLALEEENRTLGLKFRMMVCTLPGEPFGCLIRRLEIENRSERDRKIEMLDGMPVMLPYYLKNRDLKEMSNLRQAWMRVEHADEIPFYRIPALPYDTPETVSVEGGNFFLPVSFSGEKPEIHRTVVKPSVVFGRVTDFFEPANFRDGFDFPAEQPDCGFTPCAFGYRRAAVGAGETDVSYTLVGNAKSYETVRQFAGRKLTSPYLKGKIAENRILIEKLKDPAFTASDSRAFNLYCGQTFLDNLLRGGYPVPLGGGKHCFYVFSRKHGDLEREYNFFQVDSTYYSQGNSNFRDVDQNRRNDIFFFPFTGTANIDTFFNLMQLDGFNPLVLKGSCFQFRKTERAEQFLDSSLGKPNAEKLLRFLEKPFTPGSFLNYLEENGLAAERSAADRLLNEVLKECGKKDLADFGDGYWADHWTYNSDLLEQYMEMYPERISALFFGEKRFSFYDSDEVVLPRSRKYVLTDSGVRQFHSVERLEKKRKMILERGDDPFKVRAGCGKGNVYFCTLATKITVLLVNKIASLDPEGVGIEMEADKPGWCDALNGLPGLLGSSINESAETGRLARIFRDVLDRFAPEDAAVSLPEEAACFYAEVRELLRHPAGDYEYWDRSSGARETYRKKVLFGVTGREVAVSADDLKDFLSAVVAKVERGLSKAVDPRTGVYVTYFIHEVTQYDVLRDGQGAVVKNGDGFPCVRALAFRPRPLPLFLEGPVHVLRMTGSGGLARGLDRSIRKTNLYDPALGMYKICGNIMNETGEIGRQNIFPRGWLENESVFLHMEYKYFLELLRCGAYEEFFRCMKTALIPFLDPEVYGRSILENSSFLASSVYPDKELRGNGFVSRLTGASAEFLTMWRMMTVGQRPFFLNEEGKLNMKLKPVLPGWLFLRETKTFRIFSAGRPASVTFPAGAFAFRLFGKTLAVYYDEPRKDTFGPDGAEIRRMELYRSGSVIKLDGCVVPAPYAGQIRAGEFDRVDVYLA